MNEPVIPKHFLFMTLLTCGGVVAEIAILSTAEPFTTVWWFILVMLLVVLLGVMVQVRLWINHAADILRIEGIR